MQHPFQKIPANKRKPVFVTFLVLTLAVMWVLSAVGEPLTTDAAPQGIVSYELAGSASRAQEILDSWDASALAHAGFSLGFDYVYLLSYSAAIGLACVWLADALSGRWRRLALLGLWLAWGQWLAALLDAVENAALLAMLFGSVESPWPLVARWCAIPKFALVALGLLYVVVGLAARWLRPLPGRLPAP
jgi:hypothetical protein